MMLICDDIHVKFLILDCWQQCKKDISRGDAQWWYESVKNKSKLRTRRINRNLYPKKKKKKGKNEE
jgi:hypothetical protein